MPKKPAIIKNPRELAVACMFEVTNEDLLVPEAMSRIAFSLSDEDRGFAYKMVYDGFRSLPGIERILNGLCKPKKLPRKIYWLLVVSLCQMVFTRTPDYAIVDEANKLATRMGFRGLKGLVNAVLRRAMREGDTLWKDWTDRDWLLPQWLGDLLREQYGEALLNEWLETWRDKNLLSYWSLRDQPIPGDRTSDVLPHSWRRDSPMTLDAMAEHGIYVQNETSQAVAEAICRSGLRSVLDVCAAPGGKSFYVAAFGAVERLVACDVSAHRMARMRENKERLGLEFETHTGHAGELGLEEQSFELVLVDAPCSGIGIIGRHPEIKFLKKQPADPALHATQAEILENAWRFVKPGGYLLYTVCSLDKNERPGLPENARAVPGVMQQWLPEGVPAYFDELGFNFAPSGVFDGFLGMLLQKGA